MHFIMQGLAGEAADAGGSVSLFKLYEYAADKTEIHVGNNEESGPNAGTLRPALRKVGNLQDSTGSHRPI